MQQQLQAFIEAYQLSCEKCTSKKLELIINGQDGGVKIHKELYKWVNYHQVLDQNSNEIKIIMFT